MKIHITSVFLVLMLLISGCQVADFNVAPDVANDVGLDYGITHDINHTVKPNPTFYLQENDDGEPNYVIEYFVDGKTVVYPITPINGQGSSIDDFHMAIGDYDMDGAKEIAYINTAPFRNYVGIVRYDEETGSIRPLSYELPGKEKLSPNEDVGIGYIAQRIPAGDLLIHCATAPMDMRRPDTLFGAMIRDETLSNAVGDGYYRIGYVDRIETYSEQGKDVLLCRQPITYNNDLLGYMWFGLQWGTEYNDSYMWFPYSITDEWIQLKQYDRDTLKGYAASSGWPIYLDDGAPGDYYAYFTEYDDQVCYASLERRNTNEVTLYVSLETGTSFINESNIELDIDEMIEAVACDITADGYREIVVHGSIAGKHVIIVLDYKKDTSYQFDTGCEKNVCQFLIAPLVNGYALLLNENKIMVWDEETAKLVDATQSDYGHPMERFLK